MDAESWALPPQKKNYILKYITIENSFLTITIFHNITIFTVFLIK